MEGILEMQRASSMPQLRPLRKEKGKKPCLQLPKLRYGHFDLNLRLPTEKESTETQAEKTTDSVLSYHMKLAHAWQQ